MDDRLLNLALVLEGAAVDVRRCDTHYAVGAFPMVQWMVRYNPSRPITDSYVNPAPDPAYGPPYIMGDADTAWGQDHEAMAKGHFTGFGHVIPRILRLAAARG
jgi:hypothetical protein